MLLFISQWMTDLMIPLAMSQDAAMTERNETAAMEEMSFFAKR